jgi:predicted nucleic acid-binding protein
MSKVYCDTCVYIDALGLSKQNDPLRPLDIFAWTFFDAIKRDKLILITSDHVFEEFKRAIGTDKDLHELIHDLELDPRQKIHIVRTQEDEAEARKLGRANFPDALHVVLAKRAGAIFITTQNIKHFIEFDEYMKKHGIELKQPQSF